MNDYFFHFNGFIYHGLGFVDFLSSDITELQNNVGKMFF